VKNKITTSDNTSLLAHMYGMTTTSDHSFKNWTGDQTGEALGSWFTGPTAGPLGSIAQPKIEKLLLLCIISYIIEKYCFK
jgi:hypothetical protein